MSSDYASRQMLHHRERLASILSSMKYEPSISPITPSQSATSASSTVSPLLSNPSAVLYMGTNAYNFGASPKPVSPTSMYTNSLGIFDYDSRQEHLSNEAPSFESHSGHGTHTPSGIFGQFINDTQYSEALGSSPDSQNYYTDLSFPGVKTPQLQASFGQDLLGTMNGPFRGPDTVTHAGHPPVMQSIPTAAIQQGSGPLYSQSMPYMDDQFANYEAPPSPLNCISPQSFSPTPSVSDSAAADKRSLSLSLSPFSLQSPPSPSQSSTKRFKRRRATLDEDKLFSRLPFNKIERDKELDRLDEETGGHASRKDKRRLQNRYAQRAFRARARVQNKEEAAHMQHLERLNVVQSGMLEKMSGLVDRLQKENSYLKVSREGIPQVLA